VLAGRFKPSPFTSAGSAQHPGAAHTCLRRGRRKRWVSPRHIEVLPDGTFTQRSRLTHTHRSRGTYTAVLFDIRTTGLAMLELPYWLIIAGTLLVLAGTVGVLVSGKKVDEVSQLPQPTDAPRQQMPPLPSLLDSRARNDRA